MSTLVFPTLPGLGWSVHKKPSFQTIVASHVSGREVRNPNYVNPIWQFEVTIDGLDSSPANSYKGLGAQTLQALMGFFLQMQGQYQTFLFTDPTDSAVTGGVIGTGDGVTTSFTFSRWMGDFLEPVGYVTAVSQITLGGVVQASGWSLSPPNSLVFTYAPGQGVPIAGTFTYAFQCRFDDDTMDFEQFMSNLWKVEATKFKSVRSS